MEAKHTPGPWIISELNDAIDGEENILIEHEGFPLAEVRGSNDMSCIDEDDLSTINTEVIANAKLIAAAPDLLKVVQDFMKDWETGARCQYSIYESAKEAIQKATL